MGKPRLILYRWHLSVKGLTLQSCPGSPVLLQETSHIPLSLENRLPHNIILGSVPYKSSSTLVLLCFNTKMALGKFTDKGESLDTRRQSDCLPLCRTMKTMFIKYCRLIGVLIPKNAWKYLLMTLWTMSPRSAGLPTCLLPPPKCLYKIWAPSQSQVSCHLPVNERLHKSLKAGR